MQTVDEICCYIVSLLLCVTGNCPRLVFLC